MKFTDYPPEFKNVLFARCTIGVTTFLVTAVSLKLLPLSFYTLILSTSPFMTAFLQFVWMQTSVSILDLGAMCGSYLGIMVMSLQSSNESSPIREGLTVGVIFGVLGALCMSFIYVSTSKLKDVNFLVIAFNLGFLTSFVCGSQILINYFIDGRLPFKGVPFKSWLLLLGACVSNFVGLNLLTLSN